MCFKSPSFARLPGQPRVGRGGHSDCHRHARCPHVIHSDIQERIAPTRTRGGCRRAEPRPGYILFSILLRDAASERPRGGSMGGYGGLALRVVSRETKRPRVRARAYRSARRRAPGPPRWVPLFPTQLVRRARYPRGEPRTSARHTATRRLARASRTSARGSPRRAPLLYCSARPPSRPARRPPGTLACRSRTPSTSRRLRGEGPPHHTSARTR